MSVVWAAEGFLVAIDNDFDSACSTFDEFGAECVEEVFNFPPVDTAIDWCFEEVFESFLMPVIHGPAFRLEVAPILPVLVKHTIFCDVVRCDFRKCVEK